MPRSRRAQAARKGGRGARSSGKAEAPASDDEAASEVLSHYSSASEGTSVAEEGTGSDGVDEQAQQEEVEDKLKECIDHVSAKSSKTRQAALESLRLAFSSKLLFDFLLERRLTLTDSLEKCLKKGKGEEQALAASVLTLLCLQMGSGPEGEEVFHGLKPLLLSILTDASASPVARQSCATALGMCCYVAAADVEDLISCLACLEGIFGASCREEGSPVPAHHSPPLQALHRNALQSWSLLLTICPGSRIKEILDKRSSATRAPTCCAPSSKPWPPTATSTGPRLTGAGSAPSSVMCCTSSRAASATRRPSGLAWSACTWTAGCGAGRTTPSRRCWAPASGTTCRTTSCCVRSLTWAPPWCWTRRLSKPQRSPASRRYVPCPPASGGATELSGQVLEKAAHGPMALLWLRPPEITPEQWDSRAKRDGGSWGQGPGACGGSSGHAGLGPATCRLREEGTGSPREQAPALRLDMELAECPGNGWETRKRPSGLAG